MCASRTVSYMFGAPAYLLCLFVFYVSLSSLSHCLQVGPDVQMEDYQLDAIEKRKEEQVRDWRRRKVSSDDRR